MAAELAEKMTGKWKCYERENFDNYLDQLDLNAAERALAKAVKPKFSLSVEGETITYKFKAGPVSDTIKFKLGEEYEKTYMGRTAKGIPTWSDGKLKVHIVPQKSKQSEQFVEREVINGELVQTVTVDGVVTKMFYKKKIPKPSKKDS